MVSPTNLPPAYFLLLRKSKNIISNTQKEIIIFNIKRSSTVLAISLVMAPLNSGYSMVNDINHTVQEKGVTTLELFQPDSLILNN